MLPPAIKRVHVVDDIIPQTQISFKFDPEINSSDELPVFTPRRPHLRTEPFLPSSRARSSANSIWLRRHLRGHRQTRNAVCRKAVKESAQISIDSNSSGHLGAADDLAKFSFPVLDIERAVSKTSSDQT